MFLWTLDPHDPYYPPSGYDRWRDPAYGGRIDGSAESVRRVRSHADAQRLIDLYDGEIAYMDEQLGNLLGRLRALGQFDNTLIVVAGDHGEAFGEHGDFVHGHLAYEEVMHVPLLIKFPAGVKVMAGANTALAQLTDIAPTVLDVLGLKPLAAGMQGHSLLPAARQAAAPPRTVAYAETQASYANHRLLAVRDGRWKLLCVEPSVDRTGSSDAHPLETAGLRRRLAGYAQQLANPDMLKKVLRNPMFYVRRQMAQRAMLFDLSRDPHERSNVAAQHPVVVQEMQAMLEAWLVECRAYSGLTDLHTGGVGVDEDTQRQLQGLGYL
jgi:arylsulfatase A-like enzyme